MLVGGLGQVQVEQGCVDVTVVLVVTRSHEHRKAWGDIRQGAKELALIVLFVAVLHDVTSRDEHVWLEQLDLARFAILYNHGGVFADADAELLDVRRPLSV